MVSMIPVGRTSAQKPSLAEKNAQSSSWQSPWSLDDDLDHWRIQSPAPEPFAKESPAGSEVTAMAKLAAAAAVITPKPPSKPLPPTSRSTAPPAAQPVSQRSANPPERPKSQPRRSAARGAPAKLERPATSWFTPIIFSLALLGFTFVAWSYLQDSPPDSDEDLRIPLPADQTPVTTAPQRLRSFLDSVVPLENLQLGQKPAWQWDTPSLARFITANGGAFDNLRDLLEDADWHPLHSAWHAQDLGAHPAWADVTILLQAQAAYLMRRGDEEGAFTTAMDLAELSRRLQELWTWPSFETRSRDLHTAAVQSMAELLSHTQLGSERLLAFQEEFARCQPSDEVLKGALNAFYIHEKKLLLGPASGEPLDTMPGGLMRERPGRLFFKVHQTLNLFASAFRELKTEVTTAPYAAFSITGERIHRIHQTAPQFYQPNATGEKYFSDRIDSYLNIPETHSLARARHGLVMTFFALRRYAADHQRLPPSLTDLYPAYVSAIAVDPFSGEPFHYDPKKGRLSSVGTNLIAEGGKPTERPLGDDREPTIELGVSAR